MYSWWRICDRRARVVRGSRVVVSMAAYSSAVMMDVSNVVVGVGAAQLLVTPSHGYGLIVLAS